MKKLLLILTIASTSILLKAQNDLVVFSEQGERFFVVIDGVRQNAKSETNVKVTQLKQPMVTAKVIFEDKKYPDVDQKIYFMWEGEEKQGWEFTCAVVKKGEVYKIKQRSCAQVVQAPPPVGQTVVVYSVTPPPLVEVTTTTISNTTTMGTAPMGDNVNVNMNLGGLGLNMNVNVNDGGMHQSSTTTMTSSTTTSSSTITSGMPVDGPVPHAKDPIYVMPGYNGPHNCNWPMSPGDFESAKSSIESKSFEDSKLTIAKQVLGSNCMLSSQVKDIMTLFDFEKTKLDFAKFAYGKTFDPGNYFKLNDAFEFESSTEELSKYCGSYR
jgi:hypothetical protein